MFLVGFDGSFLSCFVVFFIFSSNEKNCIDVEKSILYAIIFIIYMRNTSKVLQYGSIFY
jgi:hypothetical protein